MCHLLNSGCPELTKLALSEQIDKLAGLPALGGERIDAIDHCLAGIAHLHKEVQNASSYIPAYDQKIYGEVIVPSTRLTNSTDCNRVSRHCMRN